MYVGSRGCWLGEAVELADSLSSQLCADQQRVEVGQRSKVNRRRGQAIRKWKRRRLADWSRSYVALSLGEVTKDAQPRLQRSSSARPPSLSFPPLPTSHNTSTTAASTAPARWRSEAAPSVASACAHCVNRSEGSGRDMEHRRRNNGSNGASGRVRRIRH